MPTLLLADRSLSMKRPIKTADGTQTRLEAAKLGLKSFLSYLEHIFPLEQVALMTFSSDCTMVVPFTRDHLELKESLEQVTVADKTDICNALKVAIETIVREWGVFNPVQVVLVTDGVLDIDNKQSFKLCIPFPCKLHIMLMATSEESNVSQDRMDKLCQLTNKVTADLIFPLNSNGMLAVNAVRQMFLDLCLAHYQPVTSTLKCGHLKSEISFSPSPLMIQSLSDIATDPQHQFRNPYTIKEFPSEISICGFLDLHSLSAPSVYSKHFIIDADPDSNKANDLVQLILDDCPIEIEKRPEMDRPSFRVLLHGSLKCESKVAVVQLSSDWFGLLSSASASSKKSNLILTVLFPKASFPWLGPFHYLGPKPPGKDPRISSDGGSNTNVFPVSVSHVFSYQLAPGNLQWAKEPVIQADMAKILRYSHKLPEKEASFVKELNKLRMVVFTYSMPSIIDKVCQILSNEELTVSNPQAKAIIQKSIQFLTTNRNPHEKLLVSGGK